MIGKTPISHCNKSGERDQFKRNIYSWNSAGGLRGLKHIKIKPSYKIISGEIIQTLYTKYKRKFSEAKCSV